MDGDTRDVHGDTSDVHDETSASAIEHLVTMREAYKRAEKSLFALRASGASHDQIAQAAGSLRALVQPLRAAEAASRGRSKRHSNETKKKKNGVGRAAALRKFLLATFGRDALATGSGVIDVCGGQGGLAFELLNLHGIPVTTVDPGATNPAVEGGRGRTVRRFERQFEHVRRMQASGERADDAVDVCEQMAVEVPGPRRPNHWMVYWRDELWKPIVNGLSGTSNDDDDDDPSVLRLRAAAAQNMRPAEEPSDQVLSALHDAIHAGPDVRREPSLSCAETHAQRVASAALRPTASEVWRVLRDCAAVVGMHPDRPTESILDFALATKKRFAIVPCCVFPHEFSWRTLDGRPVSTHADFVRYLVAKCPIGRVGVAELPFEGKNVVLYSKPCAETSLVAALKGEAALCMACTEEDAT